MKLTLDQAQGRMPWFFWVLLLLGCLWVVVQQLPVSWFSSALASQTGCRVLLQQPMGTIWQGSTALAFSEVNAVDGGCREPLAATERFQWTTSCKLLGMSCTTEVEFGALERPQRIVWDLSKIQVDSNEIKLPANVLEGLGSPWSTLRPRGELGARWTDIKVGDTASSSESLGVIRIIINNLSSPISPVKPLGSYEVQVNMTSAGFSWNLSTTNGPLLLRGQGEMGNSDSEPEKAGMRFSGEASATPQAQDSLIGLMSLIGKKEGNVYRLQF